MYLLVSSLRDLPMKEYVHTDWPEDDTGYKSTMLMIFILNHIIRVFYELFYKLVYKLS